jgi:hypothetical protein
VLRDRCKRRGAEIAAARSDDSVAVEAPAVRDGSSFHMISERRELEPSYPVFRVDS